MQNQKQWSTKLNNPIAKNEYDEFFFIPEIMQIFTNEVNKSLGQKVEKIKNIPGYEKTISNYPNYFSLTNVEKINEN